jgi:acetyl esterase
MDEYELLKQAGRELFLEQEAKNKTCTVDGERYILPLEGRDIEMILYLDRADAPVVFCAYGGGFALGACALDNNLWNALHKELDVTIVSIGYRKTPEFPFPCAQNDVYDAIEYIENHKEEYGISSDDYSVYGNSAGGNLATTVCMLDCRRGNKLKIKRQILNYPYCDLQTTPVDKGHPDSELLMYQMFIDYYCKEEEVSNPLVSPVLADKNDLKDMPRCIISLAENDPLHAEGARYMCKLRAAGVHVDSHVAAGMVHGYSEVFFQGEQDSLTPESLELLRSGLMEKETYQTIRFIKKYF